jgi:hypothetical protein
MHDQTRALWVRVDDGAKVPTVALDQRLWAGGVTLARVPIGVRDELLDLLHQTGKGERAA